MHSYSYIWYSETNIIFLKGRVQYNMKNKGFDLTLISFLWKPKSFFTNLKESPNITAPFVMILLLNVVLPIISTILLGKFDELIMRELTFSTITGLITNFGFLLISWGFITFLYRLLKIRNRAKVILSVLLYALLSYSYISILLGLIQPLWFSMMGTENHFVGLLLFNTIFTYGIFIVFIGFGLKWAISSTDKQFLVTFITYILLIIIIFIILMILSALLISMMFQKIGEMI